MKISKKILSAVLSVSLLATGTVLCTANAVVSDKSVSKANTEAQKSSATAYITADQQQGSVLQCFNWSFENIKDNMPIIAEQGFTAIQTSPIQVTKETTAGKDAHGCWWVYYQPVDFRIEDNTNGTSALGTVDEFKDMCDEAHRYGVRVIVDAVLNHMGNQSGNDISNKVPSIYANDSSCWHDITKNISYSNFNRYGLTHYCMDGVPDLNTGSSKIQAAATAYLKECIDNGADGFRFDAAKHIETPADVSGTGSNFWPTVVNAVTSYAQSTRNITPYYYGEILGGATGDQDANMGISVINSYATYMSVTASGIAGDILSAVNSRNGAGAQRSDFTLNADGSSVSGSKAVLWNESHDTYQSGATSGYSDRVMKQTWAMVGTRAQAMGVYMARPTNWNTVMLGDADTTAWADAEVKAINNFHNYFAGQSEYLSSSGAIAYNERGTKGVVIVNCNGGSTSVNLTANKMTAGTYKDQVSGNTFTVSGGKISGTVGTSGIAVVYNDDTVPTPTISTQGGTFKTDTLTLTVGLKNADSGTYKIGSAAAQTYTEATEITIGEGMSYDESVTITLTATKGNTTSAPTTYTFTKKNPSYIQKIYFDNSSYNWSAVYAYIYNESTTNGNWPGQQMVYDSSSGYYVLTVPEGLEEGKVVFTQSGTDGETNRYPANNVQGLDLEGVSKLFSAGYSFTEYEPVVVTYKYGDVTGDGNINVQDAALIQRYTVKLDSFTGLQLEAGDVSMDNRVNIKDAALIQKYAAGITPAISVRTGTTFVYDEEEPTTTSSSQPTTSSTINSTTNSTISSTINSTTASTTIPTSATGTQPTVITMTFTDNYYWGNVKCYYWTNNGANPVSWPGEAMTPAGTNDFGEALYILDIPSTCDRVIFNDGGSHQTVDIPISGSTKFYINGQQNGKYTVATW